MLVMLISMAGLGCGGGGRAIVRSPSAPSGHQDTPEVHTILMRAFAAHGCKGTTRLDPAPSPMRIHSNCGSMKYVFTGEDDGSLAVECEGPGQTQASCAAEVARLYKIGEECTNGTRRSCPE